MCVQLQQPDGAKETFPAPSLSFSIYLYTSSVIVLCICGCWIAAQFNSKRNLQINGCGFVRPDSGHHHHHRPRPRPRSS